MTDPDIQRALHAAYRALRGASDRFPPAWNWETPSAEMGTEEAEKYQEPTGAVPRVPRVPTQNQYMDINTAGHAPSAAWAEWQERAAMREFEGGLDRGTAEVLTAVELGPCPPPAADPSLTPKVATGGGQGDEERA